VLLHGRGRTADEKVDLAARCDEAVKEAGEGGRLGSAQIAIMGFSQGACVALEYALRHRRRCGTLMVFTGALMGPPGTDWQRGAASLAGKAREYWWNWERT
jgi:predicted esterase